MSRDKKNKDEELLIDGVEPEQNEDNRRGEEEREEREEREVFNDPQELNAVVNMIQASLSEECPKLPDKSSFLKEVFEQADCTIPVEADDEEAGKSLKLGDTCDKMIAGHRVVPALDDGDETLISICWMIHSSFAEPRLGEIKKRSILKDVFSHREQIEAAHEKPWEPQKTPADKRTLFTSLDTRAWLLGAAALAAGLAALVFTWSLRRFDDPSAHKESPLNRTKRSQRRIARMIPGPFPAEQTFTNRMELLYGERLQAHREDLIRLNPVGLASRWSTEPAVTSVPCVPWFEPRPNEARQIVSSLPAEGSGRKVSLNELYSVCAADFGRSPK